MTRHDIVWTRQAHDDLREIKRFIARQAPKTASAFLRRIKASVERVRDLPESGRVVPEVADPAIREVLKGNYRVIYRVEESRVVVLTVYHGARLLRDEALDD